MHEKEKKVFRPSQIDRYINCNIWKFLPYTEPNEYQKTIMANGTKEHTRLENENFHSHEQLCKDYFFSLKEKCEFLFKERHLVIDIDGEYLEGTPDVYAFDPKEKTLYVLDYKTGKRNVLAENNKQLLTYALLVRENHPDWNFENLILAVLNTQSDQVNIFRYPLSAQDYLDTLRSSIQKAIATNQNKKLFGYTGEWCQFCPSKRYCILQRNLSELKKYADMDTDDLILTSKKRRAEIYAREEEVKSGVYSQSLTPLLSQRFKRAWKDKKNLPEKFFTLKPMTVSEAEKKFSQEEVGFFTENNSYAVLNTSIK